MDSPVTPAASLAGGSAARPRGARNTRGSEAGGRGAARLVANLLRQSAETAGRYANDGIS